MNFCKKSFGVALVCMLMSGAFGSLASAQDGRGHNNGRGPGHRPPPPPPPAGYCDTTPQYTGMGMFTEAGLPGWCDAYPNGNYPGACEDYDCCNNVATVWCQNVRPGCTSGTTGGGGPGAPGWVYCQ